MALPPSKAPSSPSLPSNSYSSKFRYPNRRSSELTDPVRRSFMENPFTKSSTGPSPRGFGPSAPPPKDYPARRRDSISCPRECEEKENITNSGSSKLHCRHRSLSPSTRTKILPSASNSKKNFMSPTISAASKISASPRKKTLSESNNHNLPFQPSVTCSDLRSSSSSVRSLCGTFNQQMEADHKDYLAQRKHISDSREMEEKENRRDLKSKQMQVKLLPASRNTKHFMSPTVSAVSKISASPRKKIVTESNNGDQTSVRYSDLRSSCSSVNNITEDFATNLDDPKGPVSKKKVAFDPTVRIIPPVASDPIQENGSFRDDQLLDLECSLSYVKNLFESMESSETQSARENGLMASYSDEVTCESSFDTSSEKDSENVEGEDVNLNSSRSVLPPLDADQLVLELSCDPKTDSLAPGTIDDGEINHNPLDDGFIFDVFPDTHETNEADFEKLRSEHENLDSKEMMTTKPQASEVVVGKESPSRHFLTIPKWIFLIFTIFIVMMAINPHVRSYSMIKGSGSSTVSEYKAAGHLKGSVELTGEHLTHWGYDTISNIFGFMSNIKVEHEWGYICFQNLTASDGTWCRDKENAYHELTRKADDSSHMLTNFEILGHTVQFGEVLECEEDSANDVSEIADETAGESCANEANVDQEVAGEAHENEGAENIQDENGLHSAEWDTENQVITDPTSQPDKLEPVLDRTESRQEFTNGGSESKAFTIPVEEKLDDKSELDLAQTETMDEMVMDSMNEKAEIPLISENEAESPKTDSMFSVVSDSSDGDVVQTVINMSLLVISLAISATLVYRKMRNSTKVATISEEQDQKVELFENLESSSVSARLVEKSDVEVSCSTAMSSYQKDSLDRIWSKEATDEVQSQQKRKSNKSFRMESLASSSSELSNISLSPSYGSFTSYGMVPSKHRDGVEEMMVTPIRRSSRLLRK